MNIFASNKGYTLIEGLVGLLIMSMIVFLILNLMNVIKFGYNDNYEDRERILFVMQSNEDFLASQEVYVQNNVVYFEYYNNITVNYKFKNNKLIRQVNNQGYEILINNLKKINFWEENNNILYQLQNFQKQEIYGILGKEVVINNDD